MIENKPRNRHLGLVGLSTWPLEKFQENFLFSTVSCSVFGKNGMRDALREVNGLFLRLNLSFFTLYWIGVLLLTLFPVLIYWICLSILIWKIDVLLLDYTSGVPRCSFFLFFLFFFLINNLLSLIKKKLLSPLKHNSLIL